MPQAKRWDNKRRRIAGWLAGHMIQQSNKTEQLPKKSSAGWVEVKAGLRTAYRSQQIFWFEKRSKQITATTLGEMCFIQT